MVGKQGRQWFPLDVSFTGDAQVLDAGERAGWLLVAMFGRIYATGSAGRLTRRQMESLGVSDWQRRAAALVKAGLVTHDDPDVYVVPSFDEWQTVSSRAAYMREYRKRQRE